MRYVGNLRNNTPFENERREKAVFPPGSSVPDMMRENADVMERDVPNNGGNNFMNNSTSMAENNQRPNREGEMNSSFPLKSGETLRREDLPTRGDARSLSPEYNSNMGFIYSRPQGASCGTRRALNDFLCEYMGKYITVEFLFGADTYVKKSGVLNEMGMNYIVLDINGVMTVCDLTDMKFINVSTNDLI